jgi:hypothetical protein
MNHSTKIILTLILILTPLWSYAEFSPKELLDKVYGGYDKKNNCWMTKNDESQYCMEIDTIDRIVVNKRQRIFLLVTSDSTSQSHTDQGLVGAFVLEEQNGQTEIIASNAKLSSGIDGTVPKKWHLIKLGANYWGWENTISSYHASYATSWYSILAPHDEQVLKVAGFIVYQSNDDNDLSFEGETAIEKNNRETCIDEYNQPCSSISAKVKIDSHQIGQKVYPLRVSVSGIDKGKKLKPKTWTFPFDTKKWAYIEPQKWTFKLD